MSKRPNILLIIVDQMRADVIGCYGNTFCSTPNIDSIARRGTTFNRAYCTFPQCSPSLGNRSERKGWRESTLTQRSFD